MFEFIGLLTIVFGTVAALFLGAVLIRVVLLLARWITSPLLW